MNLKRYSDSPVQISLSFHMLIRHIEEMAANGTGLRMQRAQQLLELIAPYPELRTGTTDPAHLEQHADLIAELTADLFPAMLSNNEIKAVTVPFQDVLLNPTQRLQNILRDAGPSLDMAIRDLDDHCFYVNTCCMILNRYYGTDFNITRTFFYDIPNAQGIMKHYRILYNTEFIELGPTDSAVEIKPADIQLLRDNFEDLSLWKKYFPPESWIFKGFAILNLFDATVESAVSTLKSSLLGAVNSDDLKNNILQVFRSIYRISHLKVGFTSCNEAENKFGLASFNPSLNSYLLKDGAERECRELTLLVQRQQYLVVSDLERLLQREPANGLALRLLDQGFRSVILAPVVKNGHTLGILELVSPKVGDLNSINAGQLKAVMPYITDAIEGQYSFMQSQVQALIQNEYTTIHPSVYWKFRKETQKALEAGSRKKEYTLEEITFSDVVPLYGQIDIKGSSETRNCSIQTDLGAQLNALIALIGELNVDGGTRYMHDLHKLITEVQNPLKGHTEHFIQHYIDTHIHPLLKAVRAGNTPHEQAIDEYFLQAEKTGEYHLYRRKYDDTVALINQKMTSVLDLAQVDVQAVYPHYYERFRTDGVEHNMYIGAAIAPAKAYDVTMLYNLRLWQLQVICRMELEHRVLKDSLPYPLDVASLILVHSQPMSIRFRVDEKRFDVDGSYNARFEIVKKRIDKACIKHTNHRLTAAGKISIVYTSYEEEKEYLQYIRFLQANGLFEDEIEILEIEDLQSISGLKAIRVPVNYNTHLSANSYFTYSDLIRQDAVMMP